jgi:hypothetical protein
VQTHKAQIVSYRPKSDIYDWPLGTGLLLTLLYHLFVLATAKSRRAGNRFGSLPGNHIRAEAPR